MESNKSNLIEEAKWIREDIESTDLDAVIKQTLLVLSDEQLVEIIKEVEEKMSNLISENNGFSSKEILNINKIIELCQI